MPIGRSTVCNLLRERGRGRRHYQGGNLLIRRGQRSHKHESGRRYIQAPTFSVQPSNMTVSHVAIVGVVGGEVEALSVHTSPAVVIRPTIGTEADCVIDQNGDKKTPNGQFAAFAEVKPQWLKLLDFNMWNPGEHHDHASRGHDIASVGKGTIRKRRRNICRIGHGMNRRRALGLSQSRDEHRRRYAHVHGREAIASGRVH